MDRHCIGLQILGDRRDAVWLERKSKEDDSVINIYNTDCRFSAVLPVLLKKKIKAHKLCSDYLNILSL